MTSADLAYTRPAGKSYEETVAAVQQAAAARNFRVLHVHNVTATLAEKGFAREPLSIVEVCNAGFAHQALQSDVLVSLMMPCKINVYTMNGQVMVSALRPSLLAQFYPEAGLDELARQVEQTVRDIVDAAVGN